MAETREPSTAVVGWTGFASMMMVLIGLWWFLVGCVGIFQDDIFVTTSKYVFKFSSTTWGWIHMGLGVLVALAGIAVFAGALWGRIVGVLMAAISCLIGFVWLPAYPVWGVILVTASVFVIWALTVHGHEVSEAYNRV